MKKEIFVGIGENKTTPVISGKFIFRLVDSIGMPLDLLIQEIKERQIAFDLLGFIQAAKNSKNYSQKRLKALLNENRPIKDAGFESLVDFSIKKVYGHFLY